MRSGQPEQIEFEDLQQNDEDFGPVPEEID